MSGEEQIFIRALQKQVEALYSRIGAYKIQLEACNTYKEALKIQLEDCTYRLEGCKKQLEDYKNNLEDYNKQLGDKNKQLEDLLYRINKSEEDKKIRTERDKVINYLTEKVKSNFPHRKTQKGTYKYVISLLEFMLEKEIVTGKEIFARFGISRNTKWRYLQYIHPSGYFKYGRPYHIPTYTITEKGKTAKEDIKHL